MKTNTHQKIVLAGGTGFIGKHLEAKFASLGYEVILISRHNGHVQWNNQPAIIEALENAELVINLAGKSVDCRYNKKNKEAILSSRTDTTRQLGNAILACKNPPALWINSSTATIYRHAEDRPMTEDDGEIGKGFSVDVATSWEQVFFDFNLASTRQVALRMAIVLGKTGGVMRPFRNLVRFGLGGRQGNGRQMFSWIHIEDVYNIIRFVQQHDQLKGVYNCAAPQPVPNAAFMQQLRELTSTKVGLPSPSWLLKIGAVLIRTETELILKSRWVLPARLLNEVFVFQYPTLKPALREILG